MLDLTKVESKTKPNMSITVSKTFDNESDAAEWLSREGGEATGPKKKKNSVADLLGGGGSGEEEGPSEEDIQARITKLAEEEGNVPEIAALLKKHGATKGFGTLPKKAYKAFWKDLGKI